MSASKLRPERDAEEEQRRFDQLLSAMQRLVQVEDAESALREDGAAFLEGLGLHADDAAALSQLGSRRLTLYRRLVRSGLKGAIRVEIPRAAARLGARFDEDVAAFFVGRLPRSHYLRDVAFEFVDFSIPRWKKDSNVPAYIPDLARHELSAFVSACAPLPRGQRLTGEPELDLERSVLFHPSSALHRYDFAVHRLQEDLDARDEPEAKPTVILAYRDVQHAVRYLELTPLAASIVSRLIEGEKLGAAVTQGAVEQGYALDETVLTSTARLLAELAERGVLLGGEGERVPANCDL